MCMNICWNEVVKSYAPIFISKVKIYSLGVDVTVEKYYSRLKVGTVVGMSYRRWNVFNIVGMYYNCWKVFNAVGNKLKIVEI